MKTLLYILAAIVVIALIAGAVYSIGGFRIGGDPEQIEVDTNGQEASYFEERMITLGVEDIGQPIEGFDASLLTMAFPGLIPDDFDGVEAFEGSYMIENGVLSFERDATQPMTSAESTISSAGYATLLENVSARLNMNIESEEQVDSLIEAINTGEQIETRIDAGGSALGVRVIPHEVLEDSRCPIDVTCIQAGTVRVRATLESGLGTADQEFELNQPITTEAESVTLTQVGPPREEGVMIDESNYVFYFRIEKR